MVFLIYCIKVHANMCALTKFIVWVCTIFFPILFWFKRNSSCVWWAHYAPHMHTLKKMFLKFQTNFSPSEWQLLINCLFSPRGALCMFKQYSWFTAFHHVVFEKFLNFHYSMTGLAMQMQVTCFFKKILPKSRFLCQSFLGKMTAQ